MHSHQQKPLKIRGGKWSTPIIYQHFVTYKLKISLNKHKSLKVRLYTLCIVRASNFLWSNRFEHL